MWPHSVSLIGFLATNKVCFFAQLHLTNSFQVTNLLHAQKDMENPGILICPLFPNCCTPSWAVGTCGRRTCPTPARIPCSCMICICGYLVHLCISGWGAVVLGDSRWAALHPWNYTLLPKHCVWQTAAHPLQKSLHQTHAASMTWRRSRVSCPQSPSPGLTPYPWHTITATSDLLHN